MWRLISHLDSIQAGETTTLTQGVKNFCLRNSGKGIVVLISDLMDKQGYQDALRYLMAQQMDVYIIQVLSAEEIDPDVKGDLKLVDCEDDDIAEITVSAPLLKRYKQTLSAIGEAVRLFEKGTGRTVAVAEKVEPLPGAERG